MKKALLIFLFMASWIFNVKSQVTVDAKIDSLQILIGEQAHITIEVSADSKQKIVFPLFQDTIVRGVEVLEVSKPDTQYLNGNKRLLIKEKYTITSFDSALYYIPPMEVMVDNKPYLSKALALKVYSMPVDTLHPDQYFGPKSVMKPDFVWADWYLFIACIVFLIPLVILLIYFIKRFADNKPIIKKISVKPKLPAHIIAINKIEQIKNEKIWQKGLSKEYYTELTDILRSYLVDRFGINAKEMTSGEIIDKLMSSKDILSISELKELFETADLVKFAKLIPHMDENDSNLINAIDFINRTKVEPELEKKPEPVEIKVVEKKSLKVKLLLGMGIVVLVIFISISIFYIIDQLKSLY